MLLLVLAVIAAVSADVSHLQPEGYNYPQPSPSFNDEQSVEPAPAPAPKPTETYLPPQGKS